MQKLIKKAKQVLETLQKQSGVLKAQCYLEQIERTELRFSLSKPYMLRSVLEENAELTTISRQQQVGKLFVPSLAADKLAVACGDCAALMQESEAEPAFALAEITKNGIYTSGDPRCNTEKMFNLTLCARNKMPIGWGKEAFAQTTHYNKKNVIINTNGVELVQHIGWYEIEGTKINDLSMDLQTLKHFEKPYDEKKWNDVKPDQLKEKFVGTVLLMPSGVFHLWWLTRMVELNDNAVCEGGERKVHPWLNAQGETLVSKKLTISENLLDPRLAGIDLFTREGYPVQNIEFITKGSISGFPLSSVAAKKLGLPCNAAPHEYPKSGRNVFIAPGDMLVQDILTGIERGVILDSFHTAPNAKGEMAGVIHSGLLVEHGEIKKKVRCMISCNFFDIFRNVSAVSRELFFSGEYETPWIAFEGVSFS